MNTILSDYPELMEHSSVVLQGLLYSHLFYGSTIKCAVSTNNVWRERLVEHQVGVLEKQVIIFHTSLIRKKRGEIAAAESGFSPVMGKELPVRFCIFRGYTEPTLMIGIVHYVDLVE